MTQIFTENYIKKLHKICKTNNYQKKIKIQKIFKVKLMKVLLIFSQIKMHKIK